MVSKKAIKICDILETIPSATVGGNTDRYVTKVSPIDEADGYSLSFCDKDYMLIENSRAGVVLIDSKSGFLAYPPKDKTFIAIC